MNINVGELNKRIEIINYSIEIDSNNNPFRLENTYYQCWSKVNNQSGSEILKSGADFSETKTRFLIRYTQKKIDKSMLIKFQGDYYDINYVNPYNFGKEYIEIYATLKAPISYIFDKLAMIAWQEYINDELINKSVKLLVSEESIDRKEFNTSYQSGMAQTLVFKARWCDYEMTKHLDSNTNKPLYGTNLVIDNAEYNIIKTFREKHSEVIELICE